MDGNSCLILDVTEIATWPPHMGTKRRHLPNAVVPTVLQIYRDAAAEEAKRLAAKHPGRSFAIFEAVQLAITVELPSHMTMAGEVFLKRKVPHLVEIDESELPF